MSQAITRCGRPRKGEEDLRRDQFLDEAERLFVECGYGNLSMETIAREAHISLRTIYRHYGGKKELFGAVIRRFSDRFTETLPMDRVSSRPLEELLMDFGECYLCRVTRPDSLRLRVLITAESQQFPELAAEFYEQGPKLVLDHLARLFAFHQKLGDVLPIEPRFLAEQFIHALGGSRYQRLQLGLELPPDQNEVRAWTGRAVQLFLGGCLAR